MFKFKIVLLLLLIPGLFHGYSQADNCEKIRVGVFFTDLGDGVIEHLNKKYGTKSRLEWIDDIDDRVVKALQTNSPELEIFSRMKDKNKDPHYLFRYLLSLTVVETDLLVPSIANSYEDPITGWPVKEFSDPIYKEETAFWNIGSLIINSPCRPNLRYYVAVELKADLELDGAIAKLSQGLWRLTNFIEESEEERPVPARGPSMEITYEKDYLSILEKEDREMEVKVKVKNCQGEYLYRRVRSQPVYFPKDVNRCDYKQVRGCLHYGNYGNHEIVLTNKEYEAKGKYKVIEGIEASKEKVNLGTCGIGSSSEIFEEGELIIRGLEIKVKPNRKELEVGQRTNIVITFNETDPDGTKYPIEGKELEIKINGLENGTIKPKNGYTTNSDGEVILDYKAGSNDEKITVTAIFQPEDYPDKATAKNFVKVNPEEFEAKLTITKTYNKVLRTVDEDTKSENVYKRNINESINATIDIYLKLTETQDMPIFNQTWHYYTPLSVNITSFNYRFKENQHRSGPKYDTNVDIIKNATNHEITEKESVTQLPWVLAIDNNTGKAVKILPAGYNIDFDINEIEKLNSVVYTDDGPERESKTTTKTKEKSFGVGPVGEEVDDPTIKKSDNWMQDYIKKQGVELPPGVKIPKISNQETVKEIKPDILVSSGDGKYAFGGNGERTNIKELVNGKQEEKLSYNWQMTIKKKK
jgi:hypothetical protein